jgi:hypothetical protein
MTYFSILPNIQYSPNGIDQKVAKNILVRARIVEGLRNLMGASAEYRVVDGEKPEHIAHRVYGRPDFHWIVLMFNEIHDPYFSWPMSDNEMKNHMEKTYPGKALHIGTGGIVERGTSAIFNTTKGVPHDRRLPYFESGTIVEQYDINNPQVKIASAKIRSWDPDLWKLEIEDIDGVFRLQGDAARIDPTIGQLAYISDPISLRKDIVCTNSKGDRISASLLRVIDDNQYAIHHFVNETGEIVSPWHTPKGSASPLIERFCVGRQEVIEVLDELPDGTSATRTYSSVTNFTYEEDRNESKRSIRVMDPAYIDTLMRELNAMFGA